MLLARHIMKEQDRVRLLAVAKKEAAMKLRHRKIENRIELQPITLLHLCSMLHAPPWLREHTPRSSTNQSLDGYCTTCRSSSCTFELACPWKNLPSTWL